MRALQLLLATKCVLMMNYFQPKVSFEYSILVSALKSKYFSKLSDYMLNSQNVSKIHNSESYLQVKRNIDANKIQQLEETVEFLKEQVESLKLELTYKNHELEEIKQELSYTNHELYTLNKLYVDSKLVFINEVKS